MESRLLKRGETSGRSDDNAETIRKRFKTFVEQSLPVIDHYEAQGKAHRISATRSPDEVFECVQSAVEAVQAAAAPRMSLGPAAGRAPAAAGRPAEPGPAHVSIPSGTPALAYA
jgi:hypothetical protein